MSAGSIIGTTVGQSMATQSTKVRTAHDYQLLLPILNSNYDQTSDSCKQCWSKYLYLCSFTHSAAWWS